MTNSINSAHGGPARTISNRFRFSFEGEPQHIGDFPMMSGRLRFATVGEPLRCSICQEHSKKNYSQKEWIAPLAD
jgi:hypothetical protein